MAETTANRNYPLPNLGEALAVDGAKLSEDLAVFQQALIAIDADIAGLLTALDGKADTDHGHEIGDVTGLQAALNGKAAANHTHSLDDLDGVSGMADAPTTGNYVPVKTPAGWVPREAASLLGAHSHTAEDITDLADVLEAQRHTAEDITDLADVLADYLRIDHVIVSATEPTGITGDYIWLKPEA